MTAPAHQLILASAGTGKTYQLSNQLLRLLFREIPVCLRCPRLRRQYPGLMLFLAYRMIFQLVPHGDVRPGASERQEPRGLAGWKLE